MTSYFAHAAIPGILNVRRICCERRGGETSVVRGAAPKLFDNEDVRSNSTPDPLSRVETLWQQTTSVGRPASRGPSTARSEAASRGAARNLIHCLGLGGGPFSAAATSRPH